MSTCFNFGLLYLLSSVSSPPITVPPRMLFFGFRFVFIVLWSPPPDSSYRLSYQVLVIYRLFPTDRPSRSFHHHSIFLLASLSLFHIFHRTPCLALNRRFLHIYIGGLNKRNNHTGASMVVSFYRLELHKIVFKKGDIRINNLKPQGQRLNCEWKEKKYRSGKERREIDVASLALSSIIRAKLRMERKQISPRKREKGDQGCLHLVVNKSENKENKYLLQHFYKNEKRKRRSQIRMK
ncbi:unnamed protein product [Lactuca saligna]|uniref:Uncharacterized protein n=1 Tax=Lactuca saligna TaxID=75948 RepID=A0AA36EIQ1_LACSI|nr:unnamed protein product [Lactuca saligna]